MLSDRAKELSNVLNSNTNTGSRDLTTLFDITEVQVVSDELAVITNRTDTPILPNDINTTNNVVTTLVRSGKVNYLNKILP